MTHRRLRTTAAALIAFALTTGTVTAAFADQQQVTSMNQTAQMGDRVGVSSVGASPNTAVEGAMKSPEMNPGVIIDTEPAPAHSDDSDVDASTPPGTATAKLNYNAMSGTVVYNALCVGWDPRGTVNGSYSIGLPSGSGGFGWFSGTRTTELGEQFIRNADSGAYDLHVTCSGPGGSDTVTKRIVVP